MTDNTMEQIREYYIRFANNHAEKIMNGEKWYTFRYDWDGPLEGEVDLIDGDDSKFAEGEIIEVGQMTIEQIANVNWDGHVNYVHTEHAIECLKSFYPNANLRPETLMTCIKFKVKRVR